MLVHFKKAIWAVLLICIVLPACGGEQTPTLDAQMIYTSAAQTVQAALTQQAAGQASATPIPPVVTNTQAIPTAVLLDGSQTATLAAGGDATATAQFQLPSATLPLGKADDKAEWISNTPLDDALVYANAKFDVQWTMKNTGSTTWKTSYKYKWYAGDIIVEKRSYNFRSEVKPGETGLFIIDAIAPAKPGTYTTWWKLTNDLGQNFGDMSLKIIVVRPDESPTPSPTPTTEAPTEEPTATPE